jgi:hypothetical protein
VEENPNRRRFSGPKKEENFSAKCWKKIHRKKIHFLTGGFDPLPFQRWHPLSIRTQGSSRRSCATSSLRRVSAFSASSNFFLAATHSFRDTTLWAPRFLFDSDFVAFVLMCSFLSNNSTTNEREQLGHYPITSPIHPTSGTDNSFSH